MGTQYIPPETDLAALLALQAHKDDASDAHDASAISFVPASGGAATDLQAAVVEVAGDASGASTAVSDHVNDSTAAHAASAVSYTPGGTIAATTVQGAIAEVASETDERLSTVESSSEDAGNLGATHTLNVAGRSNHGLEGTLTANLALTVNNFPAAGRTPLLLTHDATGGWTLTINGTPVDSIPSDPNASFVVWLLGNQAGDDFYIQVPSAQGPAGRQGPIGGKGDPGIQGLKGDPGSNTPDDGTVTNAKVAAGANISLSKLAPIILPEYDKDNGQAGMYAPTSPPAVSASALTASRAYVVRFVPSRDMTIAKIAFCVSTAAGADDACDVGILSANLATLLGSKGATTGLLNSTGAKVVTLGTPIALTKHTVYYAAFSVGTFGGTAASLVMASWASGGASQLFGSTGPSTEMAIQAAGHPIAAPFTPTQSSLAPLFALRES